MLVKADALQGAVAGVFCRPRLEGGLSLHRQNVSIVSPSSRFLLPLAFAFVSLAPAAVR